jgi:hypothetical protein
MSFKITSQKEIFEQNLNNRFPEQMELEKGGKAHPVGTINKYNEMKMADGTWKYVGKQGHNHPAVKDVVKEHKIQPQVKEEEGSFKNKDGEKLNYRVYKDGHVKVEGSNVRKDFKSKEEFTKEYGVSNKPSKDGTMMKPNPDGGFTRVDSKTGKAVNSKVEAAKKSLGVKSKGESQFEDGVLYNFKDSFLGRYIYNKKQDKFYKQGSGEELIFTGGRLIENLRKSSGQEKVKGNVTIETIMERYSKWSNQEMIKKTLTSIKEDGGQVYDLLSKLNQNAIGRLKITPARFGGLEVVEVSGSFYSREEGDSGDKRVNAAFERFDKLEKDYKGSVKIDYSTAADSSGGESSHLKLSEIKAISVK